jgi:hypothetical protein
VRVRIWSPTLHSSVRFSNRKKGFGNGSIATPMTWKGASRGQCDFYHLGLYLKLEKSPAASSQYQLPTRKLILTRALRECYRARVLIADCIAGCTRMMQDFKATAARKNCNSR